MESVKIILTPIRWAIAALILVMASSKLTSPAWLAQMGIPWLPAPFAHVLGLWLPWLELGLSFAIILPTVWRPACRIMSALLLIFVPVLVVFLIEGRSDCGCSKGVDFLPAWFSSPPVAIVRNISMACILWGISMCGSVKLKFTFDLGGNR